MRIYVHGMTSDTLGLRVVVVFERFGGKRMLLVNVNCYFTLV